MNALISPINPPNHSNLDNVLRIKCESQYQHSTHARFAHWNARSITNKTASICDLVISEKLDILAITESWLHGDNRDDPTLADIHNTLPDFSSYSIPRVGRKGGGVLLLLRKGFNVQQNVSPSFTAFEHGDFTISSHSASLHLIIVYRMRHTKSHPASVGTFISEFSTYLESVTSAQCENLLITGDFNFHVDVPTDQDAGKFCDLLRSADLHQHVDGPTHIGGHTLDLVITPEEGSFVGNIQIQAIHPSDHFATICTLNIARPAASKEVVTVRKLRNINIESLKEDVSASFDNLPDDIDLDCLSEEYDSILRGLVDKHAPAKSRVRYLRPHSPWYTNDLREKKQELRRYERKWVKSGLHVDKQIFREKCALYKHDLELAKTSYHRDQILACDQSQLFKLVDSMCVQKSTKILPSHDSPEILANEFASFFEDKVTNLCGNFNASRIQALNNDSTEPPMHKLDVFTAMSEDEMRDLVMSMPTKSCPLDPMPTWLVKPCLDELLPTITQIVNNSLCSGYFPTSFKTAEVIPLIKKSTLDPQLLQSYRSVSNLKFISKVTEKAAIKQLQEYLTEFDLFPDFQSAYRKDHSCETALLRVVNDLLLSVDDHMDVVLVLLDLSAAFDTIDHDILIQRLETKYGISGKALNWFNSYIRGREQIVKISNASSEPHELLRGVPQGSVAGPQIFTLYASPLEDIVKQHDNVNGMYYADDSQLYIRLDPQNPVPAIHRLENCISDTKGWTCDNNLALNDGKTEVIHVTSRFSKTAPLQSINVGDTAVTTVSQAKDLGVIIDRNLSFEPHVNNICRSASLALRNIGRIRKYLDRDTTEQLVHAFISSKLDCSNSILFGLPECQLSKLQRIQNSAARLVTLSKKYEHITPILQELHWLPVKQRIIYKLMLMTYKSLHGRTPDYISELITVKKPVRTLRSNSSTTLLRTSVNTASYGQRAFSHAAPELWNQLPSHIRNAETLNTFKSLLKTHLFNNHFGSQ